MGWRHGTRRIAMATAGMLLACPAAAQDGAVGPCSPYRAADGDVPSEMPGCARRLRPRPGSLADELEFRRARNGERAGEDAGLDDEGPVSAPRKPRTRLPRPR